MLTVELRATGHPLIWEFFDSLLPQDNDAGYKKKGVNALSWNSYVIFNVSEENVMCKMNTAGGINPYL